MMVVPDPVLASQMAARTRMALMYTGGTEYHTVHGELAPTVLVVLMTEQLSVDGDHLWMRPSPWSSPDGR